MRKFALIILAGAIMTACATEYNTQKSFWNGDTGFSTTQVAPDVWQIDFKGNAFTDRATTKKYVLYKAAQIAQKQGYPYFMVASGSTNKDTEGYNGGGYLNMWGGGSVWADTTTDTNVLVKLLKSKKGHHGIVYDTAFLLKKAPGKE